jgi:hypothetical protein
VDAGRIHAITEKRFVAERSQSVQVAGGHDSANNAPLKLALCAPSWAVALPPRPTLDKVSATAPHWPPRVFASVVMVPDSKL